MKQGRTQKPVSEDTSSSENGCYSLKEMLILCLADLDHLNCWQSTSTSFCCGDPCGAQQKPREQGWEGSWSPHHGTESCSLVLTFNPALHLPLLFLSTALEEIWKCFTDGKGLQEEALSSTRCPGLPAPGCSGLHTGSAGHSKGQSGTQRGTQRGTVRDTGKESAGHSEGHSEGHS